MTSGRNIFYPDEEKLEIVSIKIIYLMKVVTKSILMYQEITLKVTFHVIDYIQCGDFPVLNVPESQISGLYHIIEG